MERETTSVPNLTDSAEECFQTWMSFVEQGLATEAKQSVVAFIRGCRELLRSEAGEVPPETRSVILILGILARGLYDYGRVLETITSPNWHTTPSLIEKAWFDLCACKERMSYTKNFVSSILPDLVLRNLNALEECYDRWFGKAWYASPEVIIEEPRCSICGADLRACPHALGQIYDGKICSLVTERIAEIRHVAIVRKPADPRCRMWPWNYDAERGSFKTRLLTAFSMADFDIDEDRNY